MLAQYISLPQDDGSQLWECLCLGSLIGATDGTHLPNTMIADGSFILSCEQDIKVNIQGGSKCQLTHKMSLQTLEHYRAIGIIVLLIILTIKYEIPHGMDGQHRSTKTHNNHKKGSIKTCRL